MNARHRVKASLSLFLLLASACDEPAPTVLGRLRPTMHDAGEHAEGGEHEREPEHDEAAGEHAEHEDRFDHD